MFRLDADRAVHFCDGLTRRDFLHVADGCREADELGRRRRVDDDLFPDRAATLVPQVVALVQNRRGDVLRPLGEKEVTEDLGRHD